MSDEPAEPRRGRGQLLIALSREDLELYSATDLDERIAALQGEIDRARGQLERKHSGRAAADALFKR
jgi:uncharacterized small protein (DUF1192 family)